MKPSIRVLFAVFSVLLLLPAQSYAIETKSYRVEVSTPILERDFALARKDAFQLAQNRILEMAIQDLVDPYIWTTFQTQILKKRYLIPKEYIASVKIHNEYSVDTTFHMILEESIQLELVGDSLKQMNFVLKSDPYFPITFLVDNSINLPKEAITERLGLLHVNVTEFDKLGLHAFTTEEKNSVAFIEELFYRFPDNGIIYLTEAFYDESGLNIKEIQTRIYRKSDMQQISEFSVGLPSTAEITDSEEFDQYEALLLERYLSIFTLQSIKREMYNQGLHTVFDIKVLGLKTPYMRSVFEKHMIESDNSISSYTLMKISTDSCHYLLQSNAASQTYIEKINQENPYYDVIIMERERNHYRILVYPKLNNEIKEMALWSPSASLLKSIFNVIGERDPILEPSETDYLALTADQIPIAIEREPNNSNVTTNYLPYGQYGIGKISSRADEDLFYLAGVNATRDSIHQYFELATFFDRHYKTETSGDDFADIPATNKVLGDNESLSVSDISPMSSKPDNVAYQEQGNTNEDEEAITGSLIADGDSGENVTTDILFSSIDTEVSDLTADEALLIGKKRDTDNFTKSFSDSYRLNIDLEVDPGESNIKDIASSNPVHISFGIDYEEVTKVQIPEDIPEPAKKRFNTILTIDWIRIGKTTLSPQIRLYDKDFNFINAYSLLGNQERLKITYNFKNESPEAVYIRVLDRIGFIQGETGGFKSYDYVIKYSWEVKPENEQDPVYEAIEDQEEEQPKDEVSTEE